MNRMKRTLCVATAAASLAAGIAAPASAQNNGQQNGLVNVAVVDVLNNNNVVANVQVPVGIAANVCHVPVTLLASDVHSGSATCNAGANGTADAQNIIRSLPPAFQP
jgi:hypothetical protein